MENYILTTKREQRGLIFIIAISVIAAVIFMATGLTIGGIVCIIFPFTSIIRVIQSKKANEKALQCIKDNGLYELALADFAVSESFINDKVRFGNEFIFVFGVPELISFREIVAAHYSKTKGGIDDDTSDIEELIVTTDDGKEHTICKVVDGNFKEGAVFLMQKLNEKNSSIQCMLP